MNPHLRFASRRARAVSAIVLFSFLTVAGSAAEADEKLHAELRQLKTLYENAINSGNLAPLEPLFAADSTGVTVDNQSFKNFAELKAIYDRFNADFPGVVYRITMKPELSKLHGDLAIAYGSADEYVKTAAGEFTYTSTFTVVLRRTDAGWKLVRSQITMDPFRNSIAEYLRNRTGRYFGFGALAIGAIVGLVAGRAIGGRKARTSATAPTTA